jgi:ligand-binding sensor domain-containing protein
MKLTNNPVFLSIVIILLCGCSDPEPQETLSTDKKKVTSEISTDIIELPSVLETYEVGKDVVVRSLTIDQKTNSLWVGSSTGVLEIDLASKEPRNTFTRVDGLANEYVFAIGLDRYGYKWFGTNAGGVSRYRDGIWKTYFPMHGLADYWIYAFAEQQNGSFWIGTWAGANKVNLDTMQFTTYVKELINEWVYGIDIDSSDRVWFGTEGGISMYDNSQWHHWTHKDGLGADNTDVLPNSPNTGLGTRSRHDLSVLVEGQESYNQNYVFAVKVAQDDTVWAGTWGGGAARYDGEKWTNFTVKDGLAGNIVYCIEQDTNGTFWFGTNHGVSRYDGQTWHNYGIDVGLLAKDVYAITLSPDGEIWVGTRHGVTRMGYEWTTLGSDK